VNGGLYKEEGIHLIKVLVGMVIAIVVFAAAFYYYHEEKKKAATPEDIHIEAVLKPVTNEKMDYKDYTLEVVIRKEKHSSHMIYPYIEGLGHLSFDSEEEEGFYLPGSVGSGAGDEEMVREAFRNQGIPYKEDVISFVGFYSPDEAGVVKMRMYLQDWAGFEPSAPMYLTYVHRGERGYGLDKSWTKIVEIKSGLDE
jgi:hypothetical protein